MRTVLVTLDTSQRTLDLEVPAEVPVRELLLPLVDIFSQCGDMPPVNQGSMALFAADATPIEPEDTLLDIGILDGARLTLRDASLVQSIGANGSEQPTVVPVSASATDNNLGGIGIRWNTEGLFADQ